MVTDAQLAEWKESSQEVSKRESGGPVEEAFNQLGLLSPTQRILALISDIEEERRLLSVGFRTWTQVPHWRSRSLPSRSGCEMTKQVRKVLGMQWQ